MVWLEKTVDMMFNNIMGYNTSGMFAGVATRYGGAASNGAGAEHLLPG